MVFNARTWTILIALAVFIGPPLTYYALGDAPRRSVLKETLSILTLLSFSLMLGQYYMARSNATLLSLFKPRQIQKVHKYIAYGAVGVMLVHPYLVVLPRHFEAGVKPGDAFVTLITTFDNLGVLLGMAAWVLLLVLAVTAYFRRRLVPRFKNGYRGWRHFHGALAVSFTAIAIWHAIELGRHTDTAMSAYFVVLAAIGTALLARLYLVTESEKPASATHGATT